MLNDGFGSFIWQLDYEIETCLAAEEPRPIRWIVVKAVFLLVVFSTFACIWFVIGLLSVGILW